MYPTRAAAGGGAVPGDTAADVHIFNTTAAHISGQTSAHAFLSGFVRRLHTDRNVQIGNNGIFQPDRKTRYKYDCSLLFLSGVILPMVCPLPLNRPVKRRPKGSCRAASMEQSNRRHHIPEDRYSYRARTSRQDSFVPC